MPPVIKERAAERDRGAREVVMLLESRINDRTTIIIDAETVGGIDKGGGVAFSHPDKALPNAMTLIRAVAETLGEGIPSGTNTPPDTMEVTFAVRVDSNAIVSLARAVDAGQLRVTLRWTRAGA
jgi:hypothetical protein